MKIVHIETLLNCGEYAISEEWKTTRTLIHEAVAAVDWPKDSGTFTINPIMHGNGVKPIKRVFVNKLQEQGWVTEKPIRLSSDLQPGNLDFMLSTQHGPIAIEWETGNISSSHRSMNKLALGLLQGVIAAGIMIVASRKLYPFLTDRISNFDELRPYLPFWRSIQCHRGVFEIVVFEHDAESKEVPLIGKGKDGNAPRASSLNEV